MAHISHMWQWQNYEPFGKYTKKAVFFLLGDIRVVAWLFVICCAWWMVLIKSLLYSSSFSLRVATLMDRFSQIGAQARNISRPGHKSLFRYTTTWFTITRAKEELQRFTKQTQKQHCIPWLTIMRHKKVSQDKWLACHTLLLFGVTLLLLVLQSLISAPSKWPGEKPSQEEAEDLFGFSLEKKEPKGVQRRP